MTKAPAHYYERFGEVNGVCDHYHRTLSGAVRCLEANQRACRAVGGYSDASIVEVTNGVRRIVPDYEYDDDAAEAEAAYQDQLAAQDEEDGE